MHMADALVSPAVAGTMYVCSAIAAGYAVKKVRLEDDQKKIPTMGVMGAFVFAAQMINFTIPGTGSSGHICGGVLLSALLGPAAGFLTMIGILLIQCLLFADGGIMAFGCNVWNMAAYGCFIGGALIWRYILTKKISRKRIIMASILACVITLQLGAFSVVLQTKASGITELPFGLFIGMMQPIHLVIGAIEGVITAAILVFVYEARPQLLWTGSENNESKHRLSFKTTILVLAVLTVVIAGGLSLIASQNPDGLEWSIENVTGSTQVESTGVIHSIAQKIQNITAVLPDYTFKQNETSGTSLSGLIGAGVVIVLCIVSCYVFKFFRKKKQ